MIPKCSREAFQYALEVVTAEMTSLRDGHTAEETSVDQATQIIAVATKATTREAVHYAIS
jgi:hypothetical protein